MAGQSEPVVRDTDYWINEDEVDLRRVIGVLSRWQREIILLAVLAFVIVAAAAIGRNSMNRPSYRAVATVAIAHTESKVNLDPKFSTQDAQVQDVRAHRSALIGLASDPAIADKAVAELGDTLSKEERNPAELLQMVKAVINSQPVGTSAKVPSGDLNSDLIQIVADADSAPKALALANAWAKAYVDQVNAVYGRGAADLAPNIEGQVVKAQADYQAAQKDYEDFLAHSKLESTIWSISNTTQLINTYTKAYTTTQTLALEREQEGRSALVQAMIDARSNARLAVFNGEAERDLRLLASAYDDWFQTGRLLDDARSLRTQLTTGGESAAASNALALQLLKVQAFGGINDASSVWAQTKAPGDQKTPQGAQPGLQLQVGSLAQTNSAAMLADVDALIQTLEARQKSLNEQVTSLSQSLQAENRVPSVSQPPAADSELAKAIESEYPKLFALGDLAASARQASAADQSGQTATAGAQEPLTKVIADLQSHLQDLRSQLQAEQARQRQLAQRRDLAWTTYSLLSNKVAELQVAQAAAGSEVRFASPASLPLKPLPRGSWTTASILAALLALVVGTAVAFVADFLDQPPFLSRINHRRKRAASALS